MRRIMMILIALFALLIMASCAGNSETSSTVEPVKLVIPTPGTDTAVVTGKILSTETGKPPEAILFLSKNITVGRTDIPAVLSFSYQSSPRAIIDTEGIFYFQDVPEGTYAITLWTPPDNAFFIPDDSGQDYKWVVVTPGQLIELGDVKAP